MAQNNTAPQVPVFVEGEILNCEVSFAALLETDETLDGTPTVAEVGTHDLTITGVQYNSEPITVNGKIVPVEKAVQFTMTGQLLATANYTLVITVDTTEGARRIKYVRFTVDNE